jgi:hypothetical protein
VGYREREARQNDWWDRWFVEGGTVLGHTGLDLGNYAYRVVIISYLDTPSK